MRATQVALLLALASCQLSTGVPEAQLNAVELPARVTGANIRAVGDRRRGYGTPKARETMERLRGLGVNTLSVIMEGRMTNLTDVGVRLPSDDDLKGIRAVLRDANAMGFATILIPHLYLDDGRWRGEIKMGDPQRRDEWWASYSEFIGEAARMGQDCGVTVLSIGVELKGMSAEVDTRTRMKHLRDDIKRRYRGLITYSANWDEAERVSFWDITDLAGVNGYYPLVPDPHRGAEAVSRRLGALSLSADREVLVLEAGYRAGPMSYVRPWEWPEDLINKDVDENAQALAWAAVLTHWLDAPGVRGLLVWVIPTDPDDPASEPAHGFNPLNRPAEEIIRRAFRVDGDSAHGTSTTARGNAH